MTTICRSGYTEEAVLNMRREVLNTVTSEIYKISKYWKQKIRYDNEKVPSIIICPDENSDTSIDRNNDV